MKHFLPALLAMSTPIAATAATADYSGVIPAYEATVKAEMAVWQMEGISVAWVEGTSIVYEAGFGEAKKDSIFRAGSVSKLFNAVAVMQLAEQGKLDLDAPLPAERMPVNPFDPKVLTLRHLLCHRSGLQREATVGSYFDNSEPTLAATVSSIRGSVLVSPPDTENRYSNIAPSVAGEFAAEAAGKPFPEMVVAGIFKPLGMTRSGWLHREVPEVIPSHIRIADGKGGFQRSATPLFDLGTIPAGNLYTTAGDLARFVAMLAAEGDSPGGRVLKSRTLQEMWEPQMDPKGAFGIGFALADWRGRKTVGHGGAVYGHSTALVYLPQEKIGVVVLCNEDIVNGRTQALANLALSCMLEAKGGEHPPATPTYDASAEELAALAGAWESQSYWLDLGVDGKSLRGTMATQPCVLSAAEKDRYILNSRIHTDQAVTLERDDAGKVTALNAGPQHFTRVPVDRQPLPPEWQVLCGSYGPAFIPLVVHEKYGRLYATTENMVDYRLTPVNRHLFAFPPGMYAKEHVAFLPGPGGRPSAVEMANMPLPRLR